MHCNVYVNAVVIEAELCNCSKVVGLKDYILLCCQNNGILICFDLIAYSLNIEISEEVFVDPIFQQVYLSTADMVY